MKGMPYALQCSTLSGPSCFSCQPVIMESTVCVNHSGSMQFHFFRLHLLNWTFFRINRAFAKREWEKQLAYLDIHMGHEDSKIGKMRTGACGVRPVCA